MADSKTLRCHVLTPDRAILQCDASFVAIPAHDGEIGFLKNRAPLLCKLGIGELRIESPDGRQRFFIDRGFAQMLNNELTVLTQEAESVDQIDLAAAETALQQALSLRAEGATERTHRDNAIARARARLRISGHRE